MRRARSREIHRFAAREALDALDGGRFGGYTVWIPLVLNRIRADSCEE